MKSSEAIRNDKLSDGFVSQAHLPKDEARQQLLRILRSLPYGNSVFFSVLKIEDPIGLLPGRIILGINKRGVCWSTLTFPCACNKVFRIMIIGTLWLKRLTFFFAYCRCIFSDQYLRNTYILLNCGILCNLVAVIRLSFLKCVLRVCCIFFNLRPSRYSSKLVVCTVVSLL